MFPVFAGALTITGLAHHDAAPLLILTLGLCLGLATAYGRNPTLGFKLSKIAEVEWNNLRGRNQQTPPRKPTDPA